LSVDSLNDQVKKEAFDDFPFREPIVGDFTVADIFRTRDTQRQSSEELPRDASMNLFF
jgi:hypothetical protein